MNEIGFIGLGNMGNGMAENLLAKGSNLHVYTKTKHKMDSFVIKGARSHESIQSLSKECNIILSCLPSVKISKEVFLGPGGILSSAKPGSIVVDHSTVDVETSRLTWEKALNKNIYFIDAPISGGPVGAKEGTLTIMCGGDSIAFEKAKSTFEKMGESVVHMGGSGTGTSMKLVNQLLTSVNTIAAMEAIILADKAGIELNSVIDVLSTSFGNSRMVERNMPIYIKKEFENSSAPIRNIVKDLQIIVDLCSELDIKLPLTDMSLDLFKNTNDLNINEPDLSAVSIFIENYQERQK